MPNINKVIGDAGEYDAWSQLRFHENLSVKRIGDDNDTYDLIITKNPDNPLFQIDGYVKVSTRRDTYPKETIPPNRRQYNNLIVLTKKHNAQAWICYVVMDANLFMTEIYFCKAEKIKFLGKSFASTDQVDIEHLKQVADIKTTRVIP